MSLKLQTLLIEALEDRFKVDATINAIRERIICIAETKTFEKYKNVIAFRYGLEFELIGVKAYYYPYSSELEPHEVDLELAFLCKSQIPKAKKEKLEKVKLEYERYKCLPENNYKIPIWHDLCYRVELEKVLSGNINLCIE